MMVGMPAWLTGAGDELPVECSTNHGRTDMALAPIKARSCVDKYRDSRRRIVLVGIEFDKAERNLVGLAIEAV